MSNRTLTLVVSDAVKLGDPDVEAIRDQTAKWQQLFAPDTERYTLSGYEDLFSRLPDDLVAYDNYAERDTRWLGFDLYRSTWEREINGNFPKFVMYRIEMDRIEISGDLAWSAFTWWGEIEQNGKTLWPAQHATHAWRKVDGVWKIVHEHLTSGVKEDGEESRRPLDAEANNDRVLLHTRTV